MYAFQRIRRWIEDGSVELRALLVSPSFRSVQSIEPWWNSRRYQTTATTENSSRTASTATTSTRSIDAKHLSPDFHNWFSIGSVFNKIRRNAPAANPNVGVLRRRMLAAQQALNRATKTLAAMPRLKKQRQQFLQQPQQLVRRHLPAQCRSMKSSF